MLPLQKGPTLIEASAGTGKTYTLCRIALRLTLEKGIPLDRILAVTFTEAATEELATRIRELYQTCLDQLDALPNDEVDDDQDEDEGEVMEDVLKTLLDSGAIERQEAIRRLRYSLAVFEEAPISTIHGFCKRALDKVALETNTPIDAELEPVENELVTQLLHEYVRETIVERSPALCLELRRRGAPFLTLLENIGRESAAHPYARILPAETAFSLDRIDSLFARLPDELATLLEQRDQLLPCLNKGSRLAKHLDGRFTTLSDVARRGFVLPDDLKTLADDLTPEALAKATRKSHCIDPRPAAFDTIEQLDRHLNEAFQALAANYRVWLREKLAEAKERRNVMSFNDLLHLLNRALKNDPDGSLTHAIASAYDAALIDEFQDTDPVQYEIAVRLFGQGTHFLFYIGDPKQAIYRFRGADIFAYFRATREGGLKRETLDKNYRSAPGLVDSVNTIFQDTHSGFLYPEIQYTAVTSAKPDLTPPFHSTAPLAIHQIPHDGETLLSKGALQQELAQLAANDFAKRLNDDPTLRADQVTFLVNNRYEADFLARALEQRGIAPDIRAERSVFQTEEATAIEHLLRSLAQPDRAALRRALYTTCLSGYTRADLESSCFDDQTQPIHEHLADWAKNWSVQPFDATLAELMELCHAPEKLAQNADGERRFTNIRHLAELLSEARDAENLSPRGLLNWLRAKKEADVSQEEDYQTRLSSDSGKPQIITVHKCKGLEFPIVIFPFLGFLRPKKERKYTIFHDASQGDQPLVIDFNDPSASSGKEAAFREELAEHVRLIYVALTRAKFENILYLCPEELNRSFPSSMALLMLGESLAEQPLKGSALTDKLAQRFTDLAQRHPHLITHQFRELGHDSKTNYKPPAPPSQGLARARPFTQESIPGPERILSFSALSRQLNSAEALPEPLTESRRDELPPRPAAPVATEDDESNSGVNIFTLPKGTAAGDLLHLALERFDFAATDTLDAIVRDAFEELQFQPAAFEPVVKKQISRLANLRLDAPTESFRLSDIPPQARIAELEFSYPTFGDARNHLAQAFASADLGRIPRSWAAKFRSDQAPLHASFLRGFIDLVVFRNDRFYIFDWKSNHIGNSAAHYTDTRMAEAMADHDYYLQYCLYCVALKRFIERRFPGEDFYHRIGGVFYVFIRGIQPDSTNGVYFDLPPKSLLQRLDAALSGLDPQTATAAASSQ